MKHTRIAIFPADTGGCGHYRLIWPWEEVARQNPDAVTVIRGDLLEEKEVLISWGGGEFKEEPTEYHTPLSIVKIPDVDVMIFQRPLHRKFGPYFQLLRERGIKIIVDLDDNFDHVSQQNVAWFATEPHWLHEREIKELTHMFKSVSITKKSVIQDKFFYVPAHEGAVNRKNIHRAIKHADLVITSTPDLARHYKASTKRIITLENCVNEWYFTHRRTVMNAPLVVGWTGSVATHPNDLQVMGNALRTLRDNDDVSFKWHVVGTGVGVDRITCVMPDVTSDGWVSLHGDYQKEYARFDIAVCPLEASRFNDSKSWLKPLEAASLGVVPVMSPLPEYQRVHKNGVGVIAKRERDWVRHINALLTSDAFRDEKRESGFAFAKTMTYERQAHRWLEALSLVCDKSVTYV